MEKEELNECLTTFYAAVRREDGTEFKVSSLKAIRAAIDRYLRQPPNNKPWSIVGDSAFQKSNKVLNAICKQMMQDGRVGPTIHKNPITSEQLQQLYETGQLGEWDTLDPSQLLRTAWFYITFYFGKRERENQRKLTSDMLVLQSTPQGRRYYEFRSHFASKIHQGVWQITSTNPTIKCLKFLIQSATRWKPLKASLNTWILTCRLCFNDQEKCQQSCNHKKMKCGTAIPLSAKAHSKTWWKTCQHLPG